MTTQQDFLQIIERYTAEQQARPKVRRKSLTAKERNWRQAFERALTTSVSSDGIVRLLLHRYTGMTFRQMYRFIQVRREALERWESRLVAYHYIGADRVIEAAIKGRFPDMTEAFHTQKMERILTLAAIGREQSATM